SVLGETFALFHDGLQIEDQPTVNAMSSVTGSGLLAITYPAAIATEVGYSVHLIYPSSLGRQAVQELFVATPIASIHYDMVDLSALPQMLSFDAYVPHDATTPLATWAADGSLDATSGGIVQVSWGTSAEEWTWAAVVPAETMQVQFPDLPD